MEEKTKTFEEQLAELLALARSKKNVLEDKEILDFFRGEILSPEKLDKIYDFLENNKVDVLQVGEDMEIDPDLFIEDELADGEELDVENLEKDLPDGVSTEDPVRMYLKASVARRRDRAGKADGAGRRGGEEDAGGGQPPSGGQHRQALRGARDAVSGSHTGGKPGAYQGRGEVRLHQGL